MIPIPDKTTLWIIKACAVGVLLSLLWLWGYNKGEARWHDKFDAEVAAHKATKKANADVLADLAEKTAKAAKLAKQASETAKAERKANDKRFDDAKHDADRARRDLAAALRAGAERLQPWWDCAARPAEGDAASVAGGQDAGADLREAGAADLIADADHADRWIVWLQTELTSTRKACGVEP